MMEVKVRDEIIKTEYLIIGGGVAGLQSAITAGSKGVDVLVAEKADTRRSGNGCGGNDHFMCYLPECHGDDFARVISEISEGMEGGPWQDPAMTKKMMLHTKSIVERWQEWGINMKPTGEYRFEGHTMPSRQCYHLKYDGSNQKRVLTNKARENGAKIMNKLYINDILTNDEGRAVGAVGFLLAEDEPEVVVIQCKAVLVATAQAMRMYPNVNPAYIFNVHSCPAAAGQLRSLIEQAQNSSILMCHIVTAASKDLRAPEKRRGLASSAISMVTRSAHSVWRRIASAAMPLWISIQACLPNDLKMVPARPL